MPRRMSDTAEDEVPKKRIAPNGNKLPNPIKEGEVFTDIIGNRWKLGRSVGVGGFGEIYLASSEIKKSVGADAHYVVKVEPHKNGPLFVEINFYIRAAKAEMISEWKKQRRLVHLGISPYIASGSHIYKGEKYRFMILERFGVDLNKLFLKYGKKFHLKTVLNLGIQILNVLEYIHSRGYIHADIKGSNLLIGHLPGTTNHVYLLDFGLACRYTERDGRHKKYDSDCRKAHNGTIEYTSRDAHIGAHSRRGDLEILGYNMLQWLCKKLPWEDNISDPEFVYEQKKGFMSNIPLLMKNCFATRESPAVISKYLKYVASLEFDTKPDYAYCRKLLQKGVLDAGFEDDGKLEFGYCVTPKPKINKTKKRGIKRCGDEPENMGELRPKKLFRSTNRKPCTAHNFNRMTRNSPALPLLRSQEPFSWEKILSSDPEKYLKKIQPHRKQAVNSVPKLESQKIKSVDPLVCQPVNLEDPGVPTPAMLEVMARMQERATTQVVGARKCRSSSRCSSPSEETPLLYTLTPAMEQVLQKRLELAGLEADSVTDFEVSSVEECGGNTNVRITRSKSKRTQAQHKSKCMPTSSSGSNKIVGCRRNIQLSRRRTYAD